MPPAARFTLRPDFLATRMPDDLRHLATALALAGRGRGFVEPNPLVGAVVLDAAGRVAGEGWHEKFGDAHAEVNALRQAGEAARGGTLYVTLEPCCHHGKTPPCTDAILRSGVRRVVAAMTDPFPKVAGGGIETLRRAGVEVEVGLLEPEARALNAPYLKLLGSGRPWVIAKWAMTLDGKFATRTGDSKWISGDESRRRVHDLRGRMDAILVGSGTVRADDPLLTARPPGSRVATRVVLSRSGDLPQSGQLLATAREVPVIVFTHAGNESKLSHWHDAGAEVVGVGETDFLHQVLDDLGRRRFTNVLVEGGAGVLGSLFDARAVDECHVYIAPKLVGGDAAPSPVGGLGVATMAEALDLSQVEIERLGTDLLLRGLTRRLES